jgi:TetR/AcrR family transcriptional regulator, regulator of mycofactocin system
VTTLEQQTAIGRRERKKRTTRDALVTAAFALAAKRGVERTTIEDITERVDVSVRTFHRYFASKEDVFFADAAERREGFAAVLAERSDDEPLLESLRAAARGFVQGLVADPAQEERRQRLIVSSESLLARSLRESDEWARLVADYCARRLRLTADDALPALLGSCTVAVLRTARVRWLRDRSTDLGADVDRYFDLLGHLAESTTRASVS